MFKSRSNPRSQSDAAAVEGAPAGLRGVNPVDGAIAAGILVLTVGVGIQMALHFRQQASAMDHRLQASLSRCRSIRSGVKHVEARRAALAQLRRDVERYATDVTARPMVPWTTVMGELSRRRPKGVWTTQISGDGPRFRVQVTAARPDLAQSYTLALRESPYVDYAGLPLGQVQARTQVSGRWTGE